MNKATAIPDTPVEELAITIKIPSQLVQVDNNYTTLHLPAKPLRFDSRVVQEQLTSNGMNVRDANRMTDDVMDFLHRQFVIKALSDLVS